MTDQLTLRIGGTAYTGWLEASVTRGLDQFVSTCELSYSDRWASSSAMRRVMPWDKCEVAWGDHTLLTGYISNVAGRMSSHSLQLRATARSWTAHLVDCSVRHATGHWINRTLEQIAQEVCEPFGVSVTLDATVQETNQLQFDRVEAEDGESAFDLVDRICRVRGVLAISTPDGNLRLTRITRAAQRRVALQVDATHYRSWEYDTQDLFSSYYLKSYTGRKHGENGSRAALESYFVDDLSVPFHRPKVLVSDASARLTELKDHAVWERNIRHGKAVRIAYDVPGVLAPDGDLWAPGMLVFVADDQIGAHDTLVLSRCELRVSERDLFTRLELSEPESYSTEPVPKKRLIKP